MAVAELHSADEFKNLIKNQARVALDFYSDDCPPCEKLAPLYERFSSLYPDIIFVKMFRQENRDLAEEFNINSSPNLIFFKDGKLLNERLSGYIEENDLRQALKTCFPDIQERPNEIQKNMEKNIYDLCIVGNGPAGLMASVYASRYNVKHIIVGDLPGGLMTSSHKICNFPSYQEISGIDLSEKMYQQAVALGAEQKFSRIEKISEADKVFTLSLSDGSEVQTKTVLLATGTKHKHLGLPKEDSFLGKGISYCATCDAMFYKDKVVAVIGGGDSANTASLYLAEVATKVYQIYRGDKLKGEPAWVDQIKVNPKIEVIYNTNVVELLGEEKLSAVKIKNGDEEKTIDIDGLFVEIGSQPETTLIDALGLKTDAGKYIEVSAAQETSRHGIWAAGDITTASDNFRQIITACSEGAIAAQSIFKYLQADKK